MASLKQRAGAVSNTLGGLWGSIRFIRDVGMRISESNILNTADAPMFKAVIPKFLYMV